MIVVYAVVPTILLFAQMEAFILAQLENVLVVMMLDQKCLVIVVLV
jgi:hypothetical protein